MPEDEITELTEMDVESVHGVGKAANGAPFLIIKSLDEEGGGGAGGTVTVIPAPADGAATFSPEVQKALRDARDAGETITAANMGEVVTRYLAKADGEMEMPMDGAPVVSAAQEMADAATLANAAATLAALQEQIEEAAESEAQEAMLGESDDWMDAYDLQDACSMLENALGIVARLAFHEKSEAVGKSRLTDEQTAALATAAAPFQNQEDAVTKEELQAAVAESLKDMTGELAKALAAVIPTPVVSTLEVQSSKPVEKGTESTTPATVDVIKSAFDDVIKGFLAPEGPLGSVLKGIEDRLSNVESTPAANKGPLVGAAASMGGMVALRGQGFGIGDDRIETLQKELAGPVSPERRSEILQEISTENLRGFYGAGRPVNA